MEGTFNSRHFTPSAAAAIMQPRVQRILLMRPARVLRSGLALKPSTLFHFHKLLTKQEYRMLFSPRRVRRPGPKGPTKELIDAVVEMKRRNRTWGCKRIAQQIGLSMRIGDITNLLGFGRDFNLHDGL